ncbi:hypothetical protein MMC16_005572 [Acarospora aff. strigata]|nr:hypothetical protein [Acarospora aff. strigata]
MIDITWLYPDPRSNPSFNYLDTLNVSWYSTWPAPDLELWCSNNITSDQYASFYSRHTTSNGSALVPLNYGRSRRCHFEMKQKSFSPSGNNSGGFVIEVQSGSPVTWGASTPTSATLTTSSPSSRSTWGNLATSTLESSDPASASSSPPAPSVANGLSTGARAGIGTGIAIGVCLLLLGCLFVLRAKKRKVKAAALREAEVNRLQNEEPPVHELSTTQ